MTKGPSSAAAADAELNSRLRANLAEIYRLIDRGPADAEYLSTSLLVERLLISPPAVNRLVNRLSQLGLLRHEPYQGVAMTASGRVEALKQIRVQRIAEVFLVQVMGINWLQAHDEALQLSRGLSEAVIERMAAMTGEPAYCPHGEPIPDRNGALTPLEDESLAQLEAGLDARITRLITREIDRLQYLEALGLVPGQDIHIIHIAPFEGPMQIRLGREFRIIGNNLAQLIRVQRLD